MRCCYLMVMLGVMALSGCTNVAGEPPTTLTRTDGHVMETPALLEMALSYFSGAGYDCGEDSSSELRCRKDLRDLYIHQTHAVVEIFEDKEAGHHLLMTTRWDEGLIPGELISSEFENPDVAGFCRSLEASGQGVCQITE
ncbi:MAG TPA: hypothetical protein DCF62_07450 [Porticoccaceae bacterium]|nr:hypothetical protein [Porticoccaceae bacterium]HCO58966.1 hypothetical protein [Porticoccaceae bacterium]